MAQVIFVPELDQEFEFPDEASDDQIKRFLKKQVDLILPEGVSDKLKEPVSLLTKKAGAVDVPIKLKKEGAFLKEILGKSEKDIKEAAERPSGLEFFKDVVKGGAKEIKGVAAFAKGAAPVVSKLVTETLLFPKGVKKPQTEQVATILRKGISKAALNPKEASKGSAKVVKDIAGGVLASYGMDINNIKRGPDFDIMMNKFRAQPLESSLDLIALGSIGKKMAQKGAKKVIDKAASKEYVKETFQKKAFQLKETNDAINAPFKTKHDDLIDVSETINKISRDKLDEPRFVENVGKRLSDNLEALEKRESVLLNQAVEKVKDINIDKPSILEKVTQKLDDSRLLTETKELDPALVKTAAEREIRELISDTPKDAKALRARLVTLDDAINWNNPKEKDVALKIIRQEYRNELGRISPEYDKIASRIHDRLVKFDKKSKSIKQIGGGEKFGKTFFKTREEVSELKKVLKENPNPLSGKVLADVEVVDAWHKWNSFFDQNKSFVPDYTITGVPVGKIKKAIQKPIKKIGLKTKDVTLPIPTAKQVGLTTRGALEAEEQRRSLNEILFGPR